MQRRARRSESSAADGAAPEGDLASGRLPAARAFLAGVFGFRSALSSALSVVSLGWRPLLEWLILFSGVNRLLTGVVVTRDFVVGILDIVNIIIGGYYHQQ